MKKIISAAAAAALLICSVPLISASAEDVTACEFVLTPDKEFVHPGETVTYTFSIIPKGDVYALQAFLELPDGFTLVENSGKLVDGVKEQLKWDDIAVTESDKLIFSGYTALNPYTNATELKIATFTCYAETACSPSLSSFFVLNQSMTEPAELTTNFLPVKLPGLKKVEAKVSTCKEHGNNEYYICEDGCGRAYKDAEGKVKTNIADEALPLSEHKFSSETIGADYLKSEANCQSPAVYYKRCVNCGEKGTETFTSGEKNPEKHTGNTEIRNAVSATESQEGYTGDKYCKDCDTLIEKGKAIPKLEPATPPDKPDTPDAPNVPSNPTTPNTPDTPDTPSTPTVPDTPSTPNTPNENKGNVITEIQSGENVPKMEITTSSDKLAEILLTSEERELFNDGYNVRVILSADNIGNSISDGDKTLVADALVALENYKLGQYYDLKLYKVISGKKYQVTVTDKPITVAIDIPDALRDQNRDYKIVRIHESKADVLDDRDFISNTVTIESDRFSTYVLVYHDKTAADADIPYTGIESTLPLLVTIGVIALLVCVLLFFTTGKNGLSEEKKERIFAKLIIWGKRGGKVRSVIALALISMLLVYYYGIGMKTNDHGNCNRF